MKIATIDNTPVVFGGELDKKVEAFDGEAWNVLEKRLPLTGDKAEVTSVSSQFADWLMSVPSIDWSKSNKCGSSTNIGDGRLELGKMFQDHMVFQRSPNNPTIWGFGTPGKKVTVQVLDTNGNDVTKNKDLK